MGQANTKLLHHIDCPGGGQVWADGSTLYVGHMQPPAGTTIFDVTDPAAPRLLATIVQRQGWQSHKVWASNNLMIINQEIIGVPPAKVFSPEVKWTGSMRKRSGCLAMPCR